MFLTQEGYDKIKNELSELKDKKRPKAVDRLQKARAMGDLSENSEYSSAIEALAFIDSRIQDIEEMLKKTKVINHTLAGQQVEIGSSVVVSQNGKEEAFMIVGELETDLEHKKLSHTSPIGKALMGKKKGEMVEVDTPSGKILYKIVNVQ